MSAEKSKAGSYNNLDLFKWIASIFVIAIHTNLFLDNTALMSGPGAALVSAFYTLARCMVPFFFMASTFFMGKKINWDQDSDDNYRLIEKNARRIFRMYLIWMLVYTPLTIYLYLSNGASVTNTVWGVILSFFLGGSPVSIHLWFLLALFLSLLLMMFLCGRKTGKIRLILGISCLLYLVRLYADVCPLTSEEPFMGIILATFRWEMFTAPLYCMAGVLMARYEDRIRGFSLPVKGIVTLILLVILAVRPKWIFLSPLLHLSFGALAFSIPIGGNPATFRILRKSSTVIYLIHIMIQMIYRMIFGTGNGTIPFLVVSALSILISLTWATVSGKKRKPA